MNIDLLERNLVEACLAEDIERARHLFAQMTPRQICTLQDVNPHVDITGYPLWSCSESWGFQEHQLPECDRSDLSTPPMDKLTPDTPLGEHKIWAPS
jgi:hypothetical protein